MAKTSKGARRPTKPSREQQASDASEGSDAAPTSSTDGSPRVTISATTTPVSGPTITEGTSAVTYSMVRDMIDDARDEFSNRVKALEASIDTKLSRLDNMPSLWQLVTIVATGGIGVVTLILAILAFGGDRFDGGIGVGGQVAERYLSTQRAIDEEKRRNDERFEKILNRIDKALQPVKQAPTSSK